jgi:hypothetical protein
LSEALARAGRLPAAAIPLAELILGSCLVAGADLCLGLIAGLILAASPVLGAGLILLGRLGGERESCAEDCGQPD